jgi:hypothetical protein
MEQRFRIVGNEVKEQSREKEPDTNDMRFYGTMGGTAFFSPDDYVDAVNAYEQHLSSLRTYIASPELKERFGDNEFGEKDIKVTEGRIKDDDQIYWIAYPVSQEQESQEDLWATLWSRAQFSAPDKFIKESGQDYTIKRRNTTP